MNRRQWFIGRNRQRKLCEIGVHDQGARDCGGEPHQVHRIAILDDWEHRWADSSSTDRLRQHALVEIFDHHVEAAELTDRIYDVDILILNRERTALDAAALRALPNLRLIYNTGTGLPHLNTTAAQELGIQVFSSPGATAQSVAEHTFALMLAAFHRIPQLDADVRSGGFARPIIRDLGRKTLAVLGLGTIGTRVAHIGQAFGMDVVAWGPTLTGARAEAAGVRRAVSLVDLARQADIFSIHLRVVERTIGIVDATVIDALRPHTLLINTSRAKLVDRAALLQRLTRGDLQVGLDVFDEEPPALDDAIRSAPGVLTPHIAWMTDETWDRFIRSGIDAIESALTRQG
ncbi:D-2-hydroxyacid dehydrogenase family protein [bacterium]|nr:MAG: D-2-hydroxyacid dehydrogenase family protein [bacterium]